MSENPPNLELIRSNIVKRISMLKQFVAIAEEHGDMNRAMAFLYELQDYEAMRRQLRS